MTHENVTQPNVTQTIMEQEAKQAPKVVENQLKANQALVNVIGENLRKIRS